MPKMCPKEKLSAVPKSRDHLAQAALSLVDESPQRLTPQHLQKLISQRLSVPRITARQIVKGLIARGVLTCSYEFGCSLLEISFQKPVRLSRHILVAPPGVRCVPEKQDLVIEMAPGASFGSGQHPTTRLALSGIEHVMRGLKPFFGRRPTRCLDIGTGSGILAIAALKLGIDQALGLDIDPCALAESRANARQNGMLNRLVVENASLEALSDRFDLILANLRLPTLCRMSQQMYRVAKNNAAVVLSGFRQTEAADVRESYQGAGFQLVWQASEKDWSAAAFTF